ncbi:synaptopodin 2-like protein isoform X2 [Betta splendens]|nr:synaptopodin 2-like protein isoform X2 [Betta splendens]
MSLIDTQSATLTLRVKRASGFHSATCSSTGVPSPPTTPLHSHRSSVLSPTGLARDITSPPDSEAYYGETDSDADTQSHTQRRQRRTPPHARSPARYGNQDEEEASEMSGYESATDAAVSLQGHWDGQSFVGVPRQELLYQPLHAEWSAPAHTLTPTPDQSPGEAEGEGDSGFQEAGGGPGPSCPPLVSPERAKEALMLGSSKHLVPMVGPQQTPVSDELCTTYMDKARQAKLQRGESVVEKQVKEARSKCRSIASLLTDAPNPNSKGVLMFKKRRQRAKKYTLTCFGKAEGDKGEETEGETGGETEEEGGSSILSGSEVDEGGFSASFDSTWDSGYLDLLDRRSSACPSNTPTTPTKAATNQSPGPDLLAYQSAGLVPPFSPSLALEENATKQPDRSRSAPMSPPAVALPNGRSVAVSRASVVLSPPGQNGQHGGAYPGPSAGTNPDPHAGLGPNPGVLNRTARPFTPAPSPPRATVTSVMFRPPQPKPAAAAEPVAAVSMVTIAPTHPPAPDARRAVSSTSLYIPPRSNSHAPRPAPTPPSALSPPSFSSAPFIHPPANPQPFTSPPSIPAATSTPFSPPVCPSPAQPFSPLTPRPPPPTPTCPPSANCISPTSPPFPPDLTQVSFHSQPTPHPPAPTQQPHAIVTSVAMATASPLHAPAADSPVAREQRVSVPAARTGILHDARRRSNKKPMFSSVQNRDVSPNPDLLSMVQNMDGCCAKAPAAPSTEAGHESGPEEDWLRLGAEACNFMQAQRGCRPPPVAPKPQAPQAPQLAGKGGQLFARRQNRMDRYVVERSPSVAAAPYSPAQTREPSPTPSLPATWKYSPNIRAPPPISYNPLLSPSCPPKAQKKAEATKPGPVRPKGPKAAVKPVDIMNHKPHQLSSTLFTYGSGAPQDPPTCQTGAPQRTARVHEVRRFSTPPPTGPALKVIVPRAATTLGEPLWRSDVASPPPFQPQPPPPQWAASQQPHPAPPAPTAPLPQLPSFSSPPNPVQPGPTRLRPPSPTQTSRPFKSAPDLSPLDPADASRQVPGAARPTRVPRPRFSTSNLGLTQPCVWRPGSTLH